MTRAERVAKAYGLRYACGMLHREIADELGVSSSTIERWLNPELAKANAKRANANYAQGKREWEDKNARGTCACGALMHVGSKYDGTKQCLACFRSLKPVTAGDERRAEVLRDRVELDDAIFRAWHEGLAAGESPKVIAFSLGITQSTLMTHVGLMRRAGRDLPFRHQVAA